MSSVAWNDTSCRDIASSMSCKAMTELAYKDWDRNTGVLSYQVVHPVCDKYQSLANRDHENSLLYGTLSRNLCFIHDPILKAGGYFQQLPNTRNEEYDLWTRRKDISKPYEGGKTNEPIYDLDAAFFAPNCINESVQCYSNTGVEQKYMPCPSKCGVHPTPCPNPVGARGTA